VNTVLPPRPLRRLIIDPLFLPLAAVLAVVLLALALLGTLVSPLAPKRRLLRVAMVGLVYLWLDVSLLLGCFAIWLRHPRPFRDRATWSDVHCRLLKWALDRLIADCSRWAGFEVVVQEAGSETPPPGPVIVLARHAGPGDSFTLVHLVLTRYHRRPRVVLKAALQWDPGLDVILNRLSGCFLPSRTGSGEDLADRLAEVASTMGAHDALLMFPEGGNWTPRRHRRAVDRLRAAGRPGAAHRARELPRVLPPRPAGTLACLEARPDAHVVVVAHSGLDSLLSPAAVWRALPLTGRPMRIAWWCVRRPSGVDVARCGEEWLNAQWAAVDSWVATQAT
jgi:1-acyl-sn-glycerol-3-phosphate acyltransferase